MEDIINEVETSADLLYHNQKINNNNSQTNFNDG